MKVSVTHIKTGYTVVHENVDRIEETDSRFELVNKRRRGWPLTSSSYHKSIYTYAVES